MTLLSPVSRRPLHHDTPHSLSDGAGERWPVVDGIPFLRVEHEGLVAVALDALDAGCAEDATVALMTNQDDWWTGPATDLGELRRLVRGRDTLSLREAMALLRLGPVADYFAHRWSDPTFVGGLALIEAHWAEPATAFELACGIGHYLRELGARGVRCTGADVVWAKCWLAKHWVAPEADYVVFDAAHPWPVAERYDLVMCHDAFYFLPDRPFALARLREAADGGTLAVSHIHNADYREGAKGPALPIAEIADLFPASTLYAEEKLIAAWIEGSAPEPTSWARELAAPRRTEAYAVAEGGTATPRALTGGLAAARPGARLRPNPLIVDGATRWPSERYAAEYGPHAPWLRADADADPVRARRLLDLPERW